MPSPDGNRNTEIETIRCTRRQNNIHEAFFSILLVVDLPEPGPWHFETEETGTIQMQALGLDQVPTMKMESPATKNSASTSISLTFNDYNDTLNVEVFWDSDPEGFDGESITGFSVENNASVDFVWNTDGLPSGEYFIYTKVDDGSNAPVFQYAPGSIWVADNTNLGTPQNVSVVQKDDSLKVSWDPPVSGEASSVLVQVKRTSDGGITSSASLPNGPVQIHDLTPGSRYETWAFFVDALGEKGPRSEPDFFDFVNSSGNNPPFFTMNLDSSWFFVVGESKRYNLFAEDLDGDPLTFSGDHLPAGSFIDGSEFVWAPDQDSLAGYHDFILTVSDGAGARDSLQWSASVYKPEEMSIDVHFSQPNLYEGDVMYVIVKNPVLPAAQVSVTLENPLKSEAASVTCDRISASEFSAQVTFSSDGQSLIPVAHGDSLIATYSYNDELYRGISRFDTTSQVRDIMPPRTIIDVHLGWFVGDSLALYWTAPGDDSSTGRALYYDLRYSYFPIETEEDYLTANRYGSLFYPGRPEQMDSVVVSIDSLEGFTRGLPIHFSIKAEDDMLNRGAISNSLSIPSCICPCLADLDCNGMTNVFDVVQAIDVAFRNGETQIDATCPNVRSDVNCDGVTDIFDVILLVNVAFRGESASVFCSPCPVIPPPQKKAKG